MTIAIRQYQRVYNDILLSILKDGRIPEFEEVVETGIGRLPVLGQPLGPIHQFIPQTPDSVFDVDRYNQAVEDILLDLQIAFEELYDIENKSVERILFSDLFHDLHSYELSRVNKQLDSLLFALEAADDNFYVSFDNFKDLMKTSIPNSTQGIVDLQESALALPISAQGTFKIDLSHLYALNRTSVEYIPKVAAAKAPVPGTVFGNIFKDTSNAWGIQVESPVNGKTSIKFSFRLKREELVNRVTLVHHGETSQTAIIQTSVDNVNIKSITDYAGGVILSDQSEVVSLDFEDRLVDYIYVTLSKDAPDSSRTVGNNTIYSYLFGLKNISLYTTGRQERATYTSKPFDFSDTLSSIGKISISANESLPAETDIEWQVGLAKGGKLNGSFVPIVPQSRLTADSQSKVVSLSDTIADSSNFVSTATSFSNVFDSNNIKYFQIASIDSEPVFGTAKLFRGGRSWFRDKTGIFKQLAVKDNFVPFSKGDNQTLYNVIQEVAQLKLFTTGTAGQLVTILANSPLYDPNKGHFTIPTQQVSAGVSVSQDTTPNYAVYSVTLSSGQTHFTDTIDFQTGEGDIGKPYMSYQNSGDITVKLIHDDPLLPTYNQSIIEYQDGTDFIVDLDSNGFPTGKILVTPTSSLSTAHTVTGTRVDVEYDINVDLTRFVTSIKNNQVFFSNILTLDGFSSIIKYRHAATNIIKASIKAKASFGLTGEELTLTQGTDYVFDVSSSSIQRLTTGSIINSLGEGVDIYVDYKYNDVGSALEQFFIWAFIQEPEGVDINLETKSLLLKSQNKLAPDTVIGEELLVNIPGLGTVDLTNAVQWPNMKGWVQFIVKTKSPDILTPASFTHFINQVIRLKDDLGNYVFVQGGKYFSELTAIREPLRQVSAPFLKTNVFKNDRTKFAIDNVLINNLPVHRVLINFEPNTTEELYQYTVDQKTGNLISLTEEWKINWISRQAEDTFTQVIVKAILSRADNLTNNITPKVFNYYIKVGY